MVTRVFEDYPTPNITRITPSRVPETGKTVISIHVHGFINQPSLKCQDLQTPVELVKCVAPARIPGSYALSVTLNGLDYVTSPEAELEYFSLNVIRRRISPREWLIHGRGTRVSVYGTGFSSTSTCTCVFGGSASTGINYDVFLRVSARYRNLSG